MQSDLERDAADRAAPRPTTESPPVSPPESPPINASFWMRALTIVLFYISGWRWFIRYMRSPPHVRYISRRLCIRTSYRAMLSEARAIQMVAAKTTIPVPKIYCSFCYRGRVLILMERLPGRPLCANWRGRTPASRNAILAQLKSMLAELRSIPIPPSLITSLGASPVASVDGGVFYDGNLPTNSLWGPYDSIQAFHRAVRDTSGVCVTEETFNVFPDLRTLIAFHDGPFGPPVFTHGDLSSFNILADGDKVTGIIDWETAAWMPAYWEYTNAWHVSPYNLFWQEEVGKFIPADAYALEMEKIRRRYYNRF
ncbi:MAG: hypothetical protein STHCBS139747_007415 [Sporothrix thermara]